MSENADETLDSALGGALRVYQPRRGYRFSLDPLLLADFVGEVSGAAIELGTGSGILALAVARRSPAARITAVELQHSLAALARRNVELNGFDARVQVLEADLRALEGTVPANAFDLVISNPPFQPVTGRHSPDEQKAKARHEVTCTLDDVVTAARQLARDGGRLAVIYPSERLSEVLVAASAKGFSPRRLRLVHPRASEAARLFMIEAVRGVAAPLEVLPPLVLHVGAGREYSAEAAQILGEPSER